MVASMHELSLAVDLVERASEIAKNSRAARVTKVKLLIGPNSGVDPDALHFAFSEATRDTMLADAALEISAGVDREFQFKSMEVEDVH